MPKEPDRVLKFGGLMGDGQHGLLPQFPFYLYHDRYDPIVVSDTDAENKAKLQGFDRVTGTMMSNKHLVNWFWDLEDMSPKQLRVFAKEEYEVDLPAAATQDMLFRAVCALSRFAPQNRNRLVLMAHTIKLNYDAALETIRNAIDSPPDGYEVKIESFEVTL